MVRVHAAGVNPVDTYIRSGQYKNLPKLPYVPGKDGAGVVEECSNDKFKVSKDPENINNYFEFKTTNINPALK